MKQEDQAKLLQAYRMAITAEQDGIADLLEDAILGEMKSFDYPIVVSDKAVSEQPWKVTTTTLDSGEGA